VKDAFLYLEEQPVLQEMPNDHAHVLDMLLSAPGKHQDVVKIEDHKYVFLSMSFINA